MNLISATDNKSELKKQITIDVNGIAIIVNHYYNGTKSIREIYQGFLERRLQSPGLSL